MRAKTCACTRRIRLDSVTLEEQALVVELLQKPPQSLYVFIVVCDVRIVEVYKVSHLLSKLAPLGCEHHDVLAALVVVLFCRDILLRILVVNILLGNAKLLLYAKLNGKTMGIPTSLAWHLKTVHCLIAVEGILNCTSKHMVDARMSVRRRRTFEEDKLRTAFALIDRLVEDIKLHPLV